MLIEDQLLLAEEDDRQDETWKASESVAASSKGPEELCSVDVAKDGQLPKEDGQEYHWDAENEQEMSCAIEDGV